MFIPSLSLISRIIPHQMFTKVVHLWQDLVKNSDVDGIYLSEENLINSDVETKENNSFHSFQLLVAQEIKALLIVEKKINEFYYQITITFENQEILDFLELIKPQIEDKQKTYQLLINLLNQNPVEDSTEKKFIFNLMQIITEPLAFQENYFSDYSPHQTIEVILRNRIEQERILHQVTQQIQQDLDLLVIVKMTIEQVQSLLQIDRLLIYQIKVPIKRENSEEITYIDTVTYEAKASSIVPSVLNFSEETCFNNLQYCQEKYLQGFYLAINDINYSELDVCLKELMQKLGVKAKIAIPIIVKNELWGLLIAHQCFAVRKWKSNEINFLKNIAEYLAVAIYQYNSYHQLEEQKKLLEDTIEKKAKQLQDALIAAEVANKSKTEFLGSISHELRTPLTCIIGLSGTLLHWSKDIKTSLSLEQEVRYLKIIQESGRKLLQLINNILDFADIEAGKSLLYMEEISLENLSKMVYLSALETARNQGIAVKLNYEISADLDLFYCDGERLYQILLNLVDNAIKFTPYGGQVIINIQRNKNQVIFQVKDTGIGINKEQIPLLFTKFQQLESYLTRTHSGTGLGLALTKHLVELHGGIIEVESIIDQGSIFTVILPNSPPINHRKLKENKKENTDLKINKTIAIICEDEEIGTFLCELLTAADYQVIWLVDVYEAINRIKLVNPSIVILEQSEETSIEISKAIKLEGKQDLYFMVIRDKISGNEWENLSNSGVDEYLLKPLQPRILLRKIAKIINH